MHNPLVLTINVIHSSDAHVDGEILSVKREWMQVKNMSECASADNLHGHDSVWILSQVKEQLMFIDVTTKFGGNLSM